MVIPSERLQEGTYLARVVVGGEVELLMVVQPLVQRQVVFALGDSEEKEKGCYIVQFEEPAGEEKIRVYNYIINYNLSNTEKFINESL